MKPIKANFRRDGKYLYVNRNAYAMFLLGVHGGTAPKTSLGKEFLPFYTERPKSKEFHRVEINVILTKAEARKMSAEWAKRRRKIRQDTKEAMDKMIEGKPLK